MSSRKGKRPKLNVSDTTVSASASTAVASGATDGSSVSGKQANKVSRTEFESLFVHDHLNEEQKEITRDKLASLRAEYPRNKIITEAMEKENVNNLEQRMEKWIKGLINLGVEINWKRASATGPSIFRIEVVRIPPKAKSASATESASAAESASATESGSFTIVFKNSNDDTTIASLEEQLKPELSEQVTKVGFFVSLNESKDESKDGNNEDFEISILVCSLQSNDESTEIKPVYKVQRYNAKNQRAGLEAMQYVLKHDFYGRKEFGNRNEVEQFGNRSEAEHGAYGRKEFGNRIEGACDFDCVFKFAYEMRKESSVNLRFDKPEYEGKESEWSENNLLLFINTENEVTMYVTIWMNGLNWTVQRFANIVAKGQGQKSRNNLYERYESFFGKPFDKIIDALRHKQNIEEQTTTKNKKENKRKKNPHGSFISDACRSDAVIYNTMTGFMGDGEMKNHSNYDIMTEGATYQCAGYTFHQLRYFRYVRGLDVRKNFGFVVTGPKCKSSGNKFSVHILIISTPTEIGGKFHVKEYATEDLKVGLEALEIFLDHQFYDIKTLMEKRVFVETPGEMMIPPDLLSRNDQVWEIVKNGTGNLVLKFVRKPDKTTSEETVQTRVESFVKYLKDHLYCNRDGKEIIEEFIRGTKSDEQYDQKPIYIKIKNGMCGVGWDSKYFIERFNALEVDISNGRDDKEKWEHWLKLYPQDYRDKHNRFESSQTIILMNHMGDNLNGLKEKPTLSCFLPEYKNLMEKTMDMVRKGLIHGDIHIGNLVCDVDEKLSFIDWDEATSGAGVNQRNAITKEQKERYNPDLKGTELTMVQLIILFREIMEDHYDKCLQKKEGKNITLEFELVKKTDPKTNLSVKLEEVTRKDPTIKAYYDALVKLLTKEIQNAKNSTESTGQAECVHKD